VFTPPLIKDFSMYGGLKKLLETGLSILDTLSSLFIKRISERRLSIMTIYLSEKEIKEAVREYLTKKVTDLPEDTEINLLIEAGNGDLTETYVYGNVVAHVNVGGEN